MKLQLIVTTMNQKSFDLVSTMNIQSDAIICNQCGIDNVKVLKKDCHDIMLLSSSTFGKSVNQNLGIMYSSGDILLFSDDDLILSDNYENAVISFFEKYKSADAVKFYCESLNKDRPLAFKKPKKIQKVSKTKMMSAGTPMLAVKRAFLLKNNIWFDASIGPGTKCPNGEDGVFLDSLFRNKANVYVCPDLLAYVKQCDSSWFCGFDEPYFVNSGYIYRKIYGFFCFLPIIRKALKFSINKKSDFSLFKMIALLNKGAKKK